MIAQLRGTLIEIMPTQVVVDVHGVGYLLSTTRTAGYTLGSECTLHTYLAVRENAMDLYGFETRNELRMFTELIKLPKIGPKTALQILSQTTLETLSHAIKTDDAGYLTKMSGIGKKSAEKIVAGLREILGDEGLPGEYHSARNSDTDVVDALITLGYSQKDALTAVQNIPKDITDEHARIKYALKIVSG